jgi:hypothetical protein
MGFPVPEGPVPLGLVWLLVLFGPLLLAFAVARPDRERSHPFLLLLLGIAGCAGPFAASAVPRFPPRTRP